MALKRKIKKDAFDKLPADIQAEYVEKDGEFVLDIDGDDNTGGDDTTALRRAKDREVQARKDAEKKARELEEKLASLDESDARKRGDIDALEKSWKEKHDATVAEYDGKLKNKDAFISRSLVDNVASQIANEISTSPKLILPHIKARLAADLDGDEPATKVLDATGKPSAATLDDLRKEFVDNKEFASIIRASKASGGGAPNNGQTTRLGGATQNNGDKPAPLASANPKDLAAAIKAKKEADANADG
ncbi:scaffold protein [Paracoccus phage vB_PmaS-R3]|uniref:Scaffold protein n=1 Tax=Paracoccus phage vB_PmaS-R3 TaxID=2494563 RepID=A0A0B5A0E2_9CAUD|nr:head scaffolding protein [Paracoccus phage vB_PmaS-R3]AJD83162.1 scaffold protein [Paracoccus phage vB_PmaS-R3]